MTHVIVRFDMLLLQRGYTVQLDSGESLRYTKSGDLHSYTLFMRPSGHVITRRTIIGYHDAQNVSDVLNMSEAEYNEI